MSTPGFAQPNASRFTRDMLERILASIEPGAERLLEKVVHRDQHSNDFAELRLKDGRSLIVKGARYDWAAARFAASRLASRLIREASNLLVPAPLEVPAPADGRAIEVYWRIDRPTLQEVWPHLDARHREGAMRSWGEMLAVLHSVRADGYGALGEGGRATSSLEEHLRSELEWRLRPAVTDLWAAAIPSLERLIRAIPSVVRSARRSSLIHNDMHMGNVLCEVREGTVECVGLIDLETALAAPPEADLAAMQVHHGPHFQQRVEPMWLSIALSSYGSTVDRSTLGFYRAFHLINMGFYSALLGHDWHAAQVAAAAAAETAKLGERDMSSARRRLSPAGEGAFVG